MSLCMPAFVLICIYISLNWPTRIQLLMSNFRPFFFYFIYRLVTFYSSDNAMNVMAVYLKM